MQGGRMAVADDSTPASPGTARARLELEQFLPYRLSVLSNRLSSAIARIYADRLDLGITEWRVMAVLGLSPGLSASGLAQRTAMGQVAVRRAVARLVAAWRREREGAAGERRRAVLDRRPAGQAVRAEVAPLAVQVEKRVSSQAEPRDAEPLCQHPDRLHALDMEAWQQEP